MVKSAHIQFWENAAISIDLFSKYCEGVCVRMQAGRTLLWPQIKREKSGFNGVITDWSKEKTTHFVSTTLASLLSLYCYLHTVACWLIFPLHLPLLSYKSLNTTLKSQILHNWPKNGRHVSKTHFHMFCVKKN